jgi:uncharacterized protein YndB with AHSA1/START domain
MTNPTDKPATVVVERVFAHPPEKLWRALTEKSLVAEWLMQNDFAPVAGQKFQLRSDPVAGWDGIIDCKVLIVDPMKRLSYSWRTLGLGSVVLFTLTPTNDGTLLRMEHSGFSSDQSAAYKGATYGWKKFLGNLDQLLERLD